MAHIGTIGVFLGIETETWKLPDFVKAADAVKTIGATSLLYKVADGTNAWYGNIGGYVEVARNIQSRGVNAIPYTFDYGDEFGGLVQEINMKIAIMKQMGIVVANMEAAWNGHPEWAVKVTKALLPIPGVFGVCSWADPSLQQWNAVLATLAPCVNFWLPQVYSNSLAREYVADYRGYGLPIIPVVSLTNEAGPNDPVAMAIGQSSVVLWHYDTAIGAQRGIAVKIRATVSNGGIPDGWFDDGNSLWSPARDIPISGGFRDFILKNGVWDTNNWPIHTEEVRNPLELSNPTLGAGKRQMFRMGMLEITANNDAFSGWIGKELLTVEAKVAKLQQASVKNEKPPRLLN